MSWSFKAIASLTGFMVCFCGGRTVHAQTSLPPNWLSTQVNESGRHCTPLAEQRQGDKLLLACGAAGAWEVSLSATGPKFVRSYAFSGDVVGFFSEPDGRLWVKLQVLEARPFPAAPGAAVFPDLAPPAPSAPVPAPPTSVPAAPITQAASQPAAPQKFGRVERVTPGEVVISLGAADGVLRGDHIEFARLDDGSEEAALFSEVIAVGVVSNVTDHNARVRLGLNETVPEGARASVTRSPSTSSLSAPPRVHGLYEIEVFARPFAAIDELGGGALLSARFGYRFEHLHLQAVVDPVAFAAVRDRGNAGAANAALIASYDSQYIELGFGFGAQTVNELDSFVGSGSGLTAVQLVRFGARDGLNLAARTNIALFHSQFQFGGIVVTGQIPLTRGYWFLLNGGGGSVGYGFGELGLRALLSGNGLAGSKYLSVTAGGVGVFNAGSCDENFSCGEQRSYGGPMIGIGGEWRF
ncbi:MAG TPA: hypothetical protein VFK05_17835 [Polyangiaceae bacterium]|nr:hypothetical protein [Polyangiaceae bacterium]